MYLKKLEMKGFKSFADKINLNFEEGITVVVGPNGSGKSNISDAVRWVLGEQSSKSLRSSNMSELIFAGTKNRNSSSMAHASLYIDNTEGKLPIDSDEVKITRKVYRDGGSDYLINDEKSRLKDVHELFLDTGIGKEGYSIIGQGKIDEILSSKPTERRKLFDEATGITKYKERKEDAEKKLDKERENLIRVNDIISELEKQVKPLEKQSEKAKEYLDIKEELKKYEVNIFVEDINNYQNKKKELLKLKDIEKEKLDKLKEKLNQNEEDERNLIEDNERIIDDVFKLKEENSDILSTIEDKKRNLMLNQEKNNHDREDVKRLNKEISENKAVMKEKNTEIEKIEEKIETLTTEISKLDKNLKEKQAEFNMISSKLDAKECSIEDMKGDMIEKLNYVSDIKSEIERSGMLNEHLKSREKQLKKELSELENEISGNDNTKKDLVERKNSISNKLLKSKNKLNEINNKNEVEKREIQEKEKKLNNLNQDKHSSISKLNLLKDMKSAHEGFKRSVKNILKLKDENGFGIHGALAELVSVPKKYETAIATALGGRMQNIVVDNKQKGKKVINHIKKKKLGRATFLPLNIIKPRTLRKRNISVLKEKGISGIASDLIKFDEKYEGVIKNSLGNIIIAEDLDIAVKISKKYNNSFKIVTLDGDVLNVGGSMTGGSSSHNGSNLFARDRQIKELEKSVLDLEKKEKEILLKLNKLKENSGQFEVKKESLLEIIKKNEVELLDIDNKINQILTYKTKNNSKKNEFENEIKEIDEQVNENKKMINKKKDLLKKEKDKIKCLENEVLKYQNNLSTNKSDKDNLIETLTNLRIELSEKREIEKNLKNNLNRIKDEVEIIEKNVEKNENQIKNINEMDQKREESIEQTKKEIELLEENIADMRKEEEKLNELKRENSKKLKELSIIEKEMIEKADNQKEKIYNITSKIEKNEMKQEILYDNMWEEYEMTYNKAKEYKEDLGELKEIKAEAKKLRQKIKKLGNINLDSIEEYKVVKERFDFLTGQRDDILDAEKKLKKVIKELKNSMQSQFEENFKIIKKNFKEVFKKMFGGGTADIEIEDSEDLLNAGINIIAQPPGKKLQNLMLLSGGEKALTAISLLFGILKMKPSPFCILDEIEAALDDANVNRYALYLKEFNEKIQFITITHRKGTMEVADVLYGVTMQEQGVSKIVSVKFEDAKMMKV